MNRPARSLLVLAVAAAGAWVAVRLLRRPQPLPPATEPDEGEIALLLRELEAEC